MPTTARAANGTQLQVGDGGGPENFTTIAEVTSLPAPGLTTDSVEVTAFDSGGMKQFIPTLKEVGEFAIGINFNNATTHSTLYTKWGNSALTNYKIIVPTSPTATFAFAAYVTGYEFDLAPDGAVTATVTFRPTDGITKS
ncbi:MAG TPA: phage tail tube protein [Thermomicrobiales bacterium]|nr:phage tail tube protein [Thermomicrobiales bacterium]